jgi:hypothetical protein
MKHIKTTVLSATTLVLGSEMAFAHTGPSDNGEHSLSPVKTENQITITTNGTDRCFTANGLPDHPTGTFPNRGNPNAIAPQDVKVCVPQNPQPAQAITPIRGTMGIAINGVQFRPNTAGYYDPEGRRGHSPRGDRNWSLDIHGAPGKLGLDFNNAHVGRGGLYHYHGIAKHLLDRSGSSLIGYAGDGYEIHYVGEKVESGWELKSGTRPNGPGGRYDGTYNEDFVYVGGLGANDKPRLDQCNGGQLNGRYVYFVTDSYPYVSRCLTGVVSEDFNKANHNAERGRSGPRGQNRRNRGGDGNSRPRRGNQ